MSQPNEKTRLIDMTDIEYNKKQGLPTCFDDAKNVIIEEEHISGKKMWSVVEKVKKHSRRFDVLLHVLAIIFGVITVLFLFAMFEMHEKRFQPDCRNIRRAVLSECFGTQEIDYSIFNSFLSLFGNEATAMKSFIGPITNDSDPLPQHNDCTLLIKVYNLVCYGSN